MTGSKARAPALACNFSCDFSSVFATGRLASGLSIAAWIRIIVPFGAGRPGRRHGPLDRGNILQEKFGQPFVIEDRPGAGGVIGTLEAV